MQPTIHLIVGPTGVGKSSAASALARATGAPVVVADRLQCFVDLATTSARSGGEDEPGVSRAWLSRRTVRDGDYPGEQAARDLVDRLLALAGEHRLLIVEGGSISLLRHFAAQRARLPFRLTVQTMHIGDESDYLRALADRARDMLTPKDSRPSMLEELAAAWRCRAERFFVASVNGFEAVLEWCAKYGVDHRDLVGGQLPEDWLNGLAELVAWRHAEHGLLQDRVFTRIFAGAHANGADRA